MTDPSLSAPFVSLVGAGPGDPGLLTLRAAERLREADVVLYDALANPELLNLCPQAEWLDVGKRGFSPSMSQQDINALMVQKALENGGRRVVRLKGGDPFVFGRGGEEALACAAAGLACEVVPGISSAVAAAAYAGIPVTHRGVAKSFAVLTGTDQHGSAAYAGLSGVDTLVFLMAVKHLERIAADLIAAGRDPRTPAATIQWASTPQQRVVTGTLADIAAVVREAGVGAPAVTVVGEVVRLHESLNWFVPQALPLSGVQVAVTRTRAGTGSALAGLLAARGAQVSEIPLLRFTPTGKRREVVGALSGFDGWLAFTSEQAVSALVDTLLAEGRDLRLLAGAKIAAAGSGTARALRERGLRADFVPERSGSAHLGATLPAGAGELVLQVGSQEPEADLAQALLARGIEYHLIEVFRVEAAELSAEHRANLAAAQVVTLASSAGARGLAQVAGTGFTAAVIGPQTERAARAAGFTRLVTAQEATLEGLTDAVQRAWGRGA
ncbi:uroporphyrinogen-III C-methyltransferase [Deinococcus cavernae]|uniref:uroporphyrinogen-III C-methyltransferase n=1 Tax=Deinococcus cavernae TaxID=2320857 RepID=A0A418V5I1_9DEIO|nr:uroporphyrinogen-III C-methyltransferase [Deinococcus cavernae]RJF71352.1 uroporphyrinogen-III C-methyltransferase [Deinococcus cavernae]